MRLIIADKPLNHPFVFGFFHSASVLFRPRTARKRVGAEQLKTSYLIFRKRQAKLFDKTCNAFKIL